MKTKKISKGFSKGHQKKHQFISGNQTMLFERKQILDKQKKLAQTYEKCLRDELPIMYYDKIKYQQNIYEVGEYIEIYSITAESYVAKLNKIIEIPKEKQKKAFIEVEWVMKKMDLPEYYTKYQQCVSTAEVFPTNQKLFLYVQSIKSKCVVLSIEQYGQLLTTSDVLYFTRSRFDVKSKQLIPDPSTWNYDCDCHQPTNPDLKYVACSGCDKWFHQKCVLNKIINNVFLCDACFKATRLKQARKNAEKFMIGDMR